MPVSFKPIEKLKSLKESSPLVRFLFNKYTVITLLFLVWIIFLDNNNIGVWFNTNRKLKAQSRQIERLKQEISTTEEKLEQLKSQKDSLEKFAREEYGFHEDGEVVYIVK